MELLDALVLSRELLTGIESAMGAFLGGALDQFQLIDRLASLSEQYDRIKLRLASLLSLPSAPYP